jgi:hypothetical protein
MLSYVISSARNDGNRDGLLQRFQRSYCCVTGADDRGAPSQQNQNEVQCYYVRMHCRMLSKNDIAVP